MKIQAKDIRPGDVLDIEGRSVKIDLVGPTGVRRGTCILFEEGQDEGMSIPHDQEFEVIRRGFSFNVFDYPDVDDGMCTTGRSSAPRR